MKQLKQFFNVSLIAALAAAAVLPMGGQVFVARADSSGLPAPAISAIPAAVVARDYIVKLHSSGPAVLSGSGLAQNIQHKFAFATDQRFQNIYGFSSPASLDFLRQKLAGSYDYLDPDQPIAATAVNSNSVAANDPGFTLNPADVDRQWALPKVGFTVAWQRTTGSNAVVVAVIDTGVDETHEDLRQVNFGSGINLLNDSNIYTGTNTDDNGHGTLVTGIIAAVPNNGVGITGAAWHETIMPIKALDAQGSGTSSNIAQAIVWAADHGANIINMSLGGLGFGHDTALADSVSYAYNKNVLLVAAAGNDVAVTGGNLDENPVFPVCDDNSDNMILGVTATDVNDQKPDFANFGKSCIDVSAPGKRILSTANHDPATGAFAPNVYVYASGTSVAVPYVVAQAVLLKSLFPNSTNKQLRDRIISTADNIDSLNPTQCKGSCNGLLGAGRINVANSIAQDIVAAPVVQEGDVVKVQETGALFYINGGKRHLISTFVKNQRFPNSPVKPVSMSDLAKFPEGSYAEPLDGTLLKLDANPTVYYMSKGLRLPITYQVFLLDKFSFADVQTLSYNEVTSWLVGSFLPPPDGVLARTAKNPTVYWVLNGVLHPINYNFFVDRGLMVFPVIIISDNDLKNFPKGDAFVR